MIKIDTTNEYVEKFILAQFDYVPRKKYEKYIQLCPKTNAQEKEILEKTNEFKNKIPMLKNLKPKLVEINDIFIISTYDFLDELLEILKKENIEIIGVEPYLDTVRLIVKNININNLFIKYNVISYKKLH